MTYPKTKKILMIMTLAFLLSASAKASQPTEASQAPVQGENQAPVQTEMPPSTPVPVDVNNSLPSAGNSSDAPPKSPEQTEIERLYQVVETLQREKNSVEERFRLSEDESSQQKNELENLRQQFEALRSESDSFKQQSLQQESELKRLEEDVKILRLIASAYSEDIENLMKQVGGFSMNPPELSNLLTGEKSLEMMFSKVQSLTEKNQAQQEVYRQSAKRLKIISILLACHQDGIEGGIQEHLKQACADLIESGDAFKKATQTMLHHLYETKDTPAEHTTPLLAQFMLLEKLLNPNISDKEINPIGVKVAWGKLREALLGPEHSGILESLLPKDEARSH